MNPEDPELSELLRTQATRHRAPESLRQQLLSQLAEPAEPRAKPNSLVTTWLSRWATPHWGWRSASVGFAVGVLCAVLLQPMLSTQLASPSLDTELVNDHVQALQNDSLVAVISTDRHTVKPWFQGQLDYAPPVYDFADQGFTLHAISRFFTWRHAPAGCSMPHRRRNAANQTWCENFCLPPSGSSATRCHPARRKARRSDAPSTSAGEFQSGP